MDEEEVRSIFTKEEIQKTENLLVQTRINIARYEKSIEDNKEKEIECSLQMKILGVIELILTVIK